MDSGLSKRQYAKWLDIPYTTYLRYEKDLGRASFRDVIDICSRINVPISEIEYTAADQI